MDLLHKSREAIKQSFSIQNSESPPTLREEEAGSDGPQERVIKGPCTKKFPRPMSSSLLADPATQHAASTKTMQPTAHSPPFPVKHAPEPSPPQFLSMPIFPDTTAEESQASYDTRVAAYNLEQTRVVKHNNTERARFNEDREAYRAYQSYLEDARKYEEARAAELLSRFQALRKRQREEEETAEDDEGPKTKKQKKASDEQLPDYSDNNLYAVRQKTCPRCTLNNSRCVDLRAHPYTACAECRRKNISCTKSTATKKTKAKPKANTNTHLDRIHESMTATSLQIRELTDDFKQGFQEIQTPVKEIAKSLGLLINHVKDIFTYVNARGEHQTELLSQLVAAMEGKPSTPLANLNAHR